MPNVITLTMNPAIDKSSSVDSVASEIKLRCEKPQFDPGGGGINVSRAMHKLGGESMTVYTAGGGAGAMLTRLLTAEGLTTQPISISDMTRENLIVYEHATGLQYRFGMPGPDMTPAEVEACLDVVLESGAEYIVASGSLPPSMEKDFYATLARRVKATDSKLIVDTSGEALEACASAGVYLLKPNLRELEKLSGETFQSEAIMQENVRKLIERGMAEVFVVSMGSAGAMLITADIAVKMRPPVVPIQSKVGAGDSMVGGIVWSLSRGDDLQTAVRYGIAAGSAAVMTPGTELCRPDDVHDIFGRIAILD